ncbi:Progestin and adipoQ receptor member 3 [Chytridiales sp. JEL 0842]|nr:Progestin and adipoQ receptor member 3 [Chytridiales sp. JEL 0842]
MPASQTRPPKPSLDPNLQAPTANQEEEEESCGSTHVPETGQARASWKKPGSTRKNTTTSHHGGNVLDEEGMGCALLVVSEQQQKLECEEMRIEKEGVEESKTLLLLKRSVGGNDSSTTTTTTNSSRGMKRSTRSSVRKEAERQVVDSLFEHPPPPPQTLANSSAKDSESTLLAKTPSIDAGSITTTGEQMDIESDDEPHQLRALLRKPGGGHNPSHLKWFQKGRITLFGFKEVPRYMQDNPAILGGYRTACTYKENWMSLVHWHNESCNIWSHLIGAFVFILFPITLLFPSTFLSSHFLSYPLTDLLILGTFTLLAAYTFLTSALYHLHLSHSLEAYTFYGCLDYSGISATVGGTALTVLHFLFYCQPTPRTLWTVSICLCNLVVVLGFMDWRLNVAQCSVSA